MNAHRLIANNENGQLHIILPEEIKSEKVEVILVPLSQSLDLKEKNDLIKNLWGSVNLNRSVDDIENTIKNMRDEWSREI
mgnify:CR=1 FL=1